MLNDTMNDNITGDLRGKRAAFGRIDDGSFFNGLSSAFDGLPPAKTFGGRYGGG